MPIADKSIIDPGAVDAKAPLKKSAVAWTVGILLVLAMIGYAVPQMMRLTVSQDEPTVDKRRNTGTEDQIEAEQAALRKAAREKAAHEAAAALVLPAPLPLPAASQPAVPTTGSAQVAQAGMTPADEIEASARTSRSVLVDSSNGIMGTDSSPSKAEQRAAKDAELEASLANRGSGSGDGADPADRFANLLKVQASAQAPRDSDRDWIKEYSELKPTHAITPSRVKNPFTLIQGKVIPAVLGKSLNSDLPGDITAFTTMDIYDSLSGQHLLIPKGSMLVGEYSNRVKPGQDRMLFAFSRIVLPNGISFDLPGNKGEDQTGASGITGDVDNHYFKRFTSGILIALLADKLESGSTAPVTNIGTTGGGPNTAAGKVLSEIATADLGRNKDIAPTITIPKGTRINVQVSADMEFPSPYINRRRM